MYCFGSNSLFCSASNNNMHLQLTEGCGAMWDLLSAQEMFLGKSFPSQCWKKRLDFFLKWDNE